MPIEISMPRLSDTMERGTLVHWNVKEGQKVRAGDALGDIETDKATMELQSFDEGTVAALLLKEGQTVDIGKVILVLAGAGEDAAQVKAKYAGSATAEAGSGAHAKGAATASAAGSSSGSSGGSTAIMEPPSPTSARTNTAGLGANGHHSGSAATTPGGRIMASPLARKIADERGIDLSTLTGTGPGGRIVRKDVESAPAQAAGALAQRAGREAAAPRSAAPSAAFDAGHSGGAGLQKRTVPMSNMRRTIARRLVESKTTIPHYQVTVTVAMDALLDLRKQLNEQLADQGVKLSVNDFLVRACALAMHQHPFVNASWGSDGESIVLHDRVNIGVAIALTGEAGGLVVATLRDADRVGLRAISAGTKALGEKARTRGLTIDEMSDATFTISNLGMFGVEHFTAIINPPNAAILAVGGAVQKPVVRNGQIVVGHEMQMTMSSDHRVIDGAMTAAYLATVKGMLEKPATLLV